MAYLKTVVACAGGAALTIYILHKMKAYIDSSKLRRRLAEKCKEWPKDVVILHGIRRGKLTPNPSPFVMKVETFLRMHRIPYIFDCEFPKGDKQKMPWITFNGRHYTDSQLIIDFLSEKYGVDDSVQTDDKSLSGASAMARIVMDEHFFWGLILWRYVYSNGKDFDKIFNMSPAELKAFQEMTYPKYKKFSWYQGIGRHSQEEVIKLMNQDLRALSNFLGNKKFLRGETPSSDDCAVFGMLAQIVWNDVNSPFTKLLEEELQNLREYCFRMKEWFWQDWNEVINLATL